MSSLKSIPVQCLRWPDNWSSTLVLFEGNRDSIKTFAGNRHTPQGKLDFPGKSEHMVTLRTLPDLGHPSHIYSRIREWSPISNQDLTSVPHGSWWTLQSYLPCPASGPQSIIQKWMPQLGQPFRTAIELAQKMDIHKLCAFETNDLYLLRGELTSKWLSWISLWNQYSLETPSRSISHNRKSPVK